MISVFDMFSIGIGPSSSHTVGPMKAAKMFVESLEEVGLLELTDCIKTELFGSLGQTGLGHATGKAVILGLSGESPEEIPVEAINSILDVVNKTKNLLLAGKHSIPFPINDSIIYHQRKTLPEHANAMTLFAYSGDEKLLEKTYFSIGGGFIVEDCDFDQRKDKALSLHLNIVRPYTFTSADQLVELTTENGISISTLMMDNEKCLNEESVIREKLLNIWQVMKDSVERGMHTEGILPGGLKVNRRASALYRSLNVESNNDASFKLFVITD